MKTAKLPPVRVDATVHAEIESVLRPGETLSRFVENAPDKPLSAAGLNKSFLNADELR